MQQYQVSMSESFHAFPTLLSQKLASVSFLFQRLVTEVYIFAQSLYFRRMSKGGMLAVAH